MPTHPQLRKPRNVDDILNAYRRRRLNAEQGYKPLDFGGGAITGSMNQEGRIIALNTYHPQHGYITLTSAPPFPESQRYDPNAVRAYRQSLIELDGFGMRFDSPIVRHEAWLLEDAIPYLRLTLANGVIADVITFVPRRKPFGVVQWWRFSESGRFGYIDGKLWLQRAAYTQLTEGGPANMPSVETHPHYDDATGSFWIDNEQLGAAAVFNWTENVDSADGSVDMNQPKRDFLPQLIMYPQIMPAGGQVLELDTTILPFVIGVDSTRARVDFEELKASNIKQLLTDTLDVWRSRWVTWRHGDHPLDLVLRRAIVYGMHCCVPVTDEATCIITDHMLLPLSWNRDSYYVARALLNWRADMAQVVRKHLIWLFEVAERTEDGAWGRAYLVNGRIKDAAFQLDQQIFPLLELAEYVLETGDKATLRRLQHYIQPAVQMLLKYKASDAWLLATAETPADDPIDQPYHFSSHVLLWHTFSKLARLGLENEDYAAWAAHVREAIDDYFIAQHNGDKLYAYATDCDGSFHFYHDANDVPLVMAPHWGMCGSDDPIWQATVDFAFSKQNIGGEFDGLLGSTHTKAPWPLGDAQDILIARARRDTPRELAAQRRILKAMQWDGALSEAYNTKSYRVVSRNWFAWPNAMLGIIYIGELDKLRPQYSVSYTSSTLKIGVIATRLAGVDGVSLEAEKMVRVFEAMGHECYYIAGELDAQARPGWLVPAMHFYDPVAKQIHDEVFRTAQPRPSTIKRIYTLADRIRQEIEGFVDEFKIDLLISQNASTLPSNISLGVAITDVVKRSRMRTICHHHDFYWERDDRFINNGIEDILREAFPPKLPIIQHLVTNTPMQRRLYEFRGIDALYLPNVLDFDTPPPLLDAYALTLRDALGLDADDLIVLQPTRVRRHKTVEKAIELVRRLRDERLVLIVTGTEHDEPGDYGRWVREEADRAGIRYRFIGDMVGARRGTRHGQRVYSMWDIYPQAHFVTYPSVYEGFGNALLEAVYFHKPFVVHRYPAYLADIKPVGIRAVEFWHDITDDVLRQTRDIINDEALRKQMTEQNYQVGQEYFSLKVLRATMDTVLKRLYG